MMTEDRVASALGSISAQLSSLSDRMDRDREDRLIKEQEESEYRQDISRRIQSLENNQLVLIQKDKNIEDRVKKAEGVTTLITNARNQAVGAFMVISIFGSLTFIALSESVKEAIKHATGWLFTGTGG